MWSTARQIAAGDLVIVWMTREELQPLIVSPGKEFNGKFGVYSHSDLLGIPYGSKVGSRNGKGFIHVLRPTPELWTMALPHRTQILYLADIAFVVSYLNIIPGSRVIEAGTGSGSFSHSVARTIGSRGHLYSYEFHEARANKARDEFRSHGLSDRITLTHRNVCKDGFTVTDLVDSVFLDLPAPWEAVGHAKKALRKDRATRVCCFSPCIEQVLRTVTALNEAGFTDITMYETLLRPHEVHTLPALRPISEVGEKLRQSEARREDKRLKQIATSQAKREKGGKKRKRGPQVNEDMMEQEDQERDAVKPELQDQFIAEDSRAETKKLRTEGEEPVDGERVDQSIADTDRDSAAPPMSALEEEVPDTNPSLGASEEPAAWSVLTEAVAVHELVSASPTPSFSEPQKMVISRVANEVRGHTSYLTFAVLLPTALSQNELGVTVDGVPTEKPDDSTTPSSINPENALSNNEDVQMKLTV
ncbi:hypothetical protein M0805_005911 [Coniferiporia weirii]|nr:hypothetical protein M0805_005911 [Coniferiporia weirii]